RRDVRGGRAARDRHGPRTPLCHGRGDRMSTETATEPRTLLDVRDLEVHFPIRRGVVVERTVGHVRAVDGVSLSIEAGRTYGLVGESGCGKTTLGRAVLRLEEPTAGAVSLDGTDVTALRSEHLRRFRAKMQMVFQDPLGSLNPRHNVEMLLAEPLKVHGVGSRAERRKLAVETLDAV